MAWIGLRDQRGGWFRPTESKAQGIGACVERAPRSHFIKRGSLVVETRISAERRPQILFSFTRSWPRAGKFTIQAVPYGGIVFVDSYGDDFRHGTLPIDANGRIDLVRLTYSWNTDAGCATLTLEQPETDDSTTVTFEDPVAILADDLRQIFTQASKCDIDEEVSFAALSGTIEPVGPMPALTAHVPLLTDTGEVHACQIKRGDRVVTDEGQLVPVLQVVKRTVPARGSFRPIRLRAPYFNLSRDIVVAPQQRLVMRGSQVEYMFGKEAVLVPARHLVNDRAAFWANGPDTVTYHHLVLPGHETILASGCPLESLYLGRLRRKPETLLASVLSKFDRSRLPEHPNPIWPVLKPYEAVTLASMRAA